MRYIIKLGILCLLINGFRYSAVAQDFEATISFADKQFENHNYQLAVKEYQRALFFAKGRRLDYLYNQIASSFYVNKQYNQAQYFYELSYKTSKNDSLKFELLIKKAQCFLYLKRFDKALIELFNLPDNKSNSYTDRKNFYLAITYFALENFDKSEQHFIELAKTEENKKKISKIFSKKRMLDKPNPKTAKILSMILPGAGQLYAGDVKNSINSLSLTGGIASLGIFLAAKYSYLDAILTALPWFVRYYKGGYTTAYESATKKRNKRRQKTYRHIIEIVKK